MIPLLEELYKEIEHGDTEHRKWLWDKIEDFSKRKEIEAEKWAKEVLDANRDYLNSKEQFLNQFL